MQKVNHENAPHVISVTYIIRTHELKNTGELVPVTKNKDIVVSKRCNNLKEAKELEEKLIEETKNHAKRIQEI